VYQALAAISTHIPAAISSARKDSKVFSKEQGVHGQCQTPNFFTILIS
jgi:hypothetical protein